MNQSAFDARAFWNAVAKDWEIQVGHSGDRNRVLNSDPVLWRMLGDVSGRRLLDAGCGTGYLTRQLHIKGAKVVGVDFSKEMIRIAASHNDGIDYRVDSVTRLESIPSESVDAVIANYVLMDVENLDDAMTAFARVLVPMGEAVLVFSHPCFPQSGYSSSSINDVSSYSWPFNYFESQKRVDPPWGHFSHEFIWFHRPLSVYWKAFGDAGFTVANFEEPVLTPERASEAKDKTELHNNSSRPYSVAFKLMKL